MAKTSKYVTTPAPRDVPGYAHAVANKTIPQVPSTVPELTVTPTAKQRLNTLIRVSIILLIALLTVIFVGQNDEGALPWSSVAVLLAVTLSGGIVLRAYLNKWGRAMIAELQNGYITTTFKLGRFWIGSAPDGPITNGWIQWDWNSTWILNAQGEVVAAPTSRTDPPGLYPSPRREGQLELWTGHQWTGYFPNT